MKIAIYSRKSKFTGKGESVENQISMCKQYAYSHFENITEESFKVYEDEGFSGSNTSRPEFQRLLKETKTENFDIINPGPTQAVISNPVILIHNFPLLLL